MRNYRLAITLIVAGTLAACTPTGTTKSGSYGRYEEDLSVYRENQPTPEEPIVSAKADSVQAWESTEAMDISNSLAQGMGVIWQDRLASGRVPGYTIQLYNGANREKAESLKGIAYSVLPHQRPRLTFDSPNWRLLVGRYYTELEAKEDYYRLRERVNSAIIVTSSISLD